MKSQSFSCIFVKALDKKMFRPAMLSSRISKPLARASARSFGSALNVSLKDSDPELHTIIESVSATLGQSKMDSSSCRSWLFLLHFKRQR